MRKFRTSGADAGQPLAAWLAARLEEDEAAARARVAAGSVYVDGKRVRDAAMKLPAAVTVTVHETAVAAVAARVTAPMAAPEPAGTVEAGWRVVLEARGALVVDKPAGLAVQAERGRAGALDEQVAARFPGATLVHRIDRDTSGLVLFATSDAARKALADHLAAGRLTREYLAVVALDAPAPAAGATVKLDAPLGADPRDRRRQAARVSGGQPAESLVTLERAGAARALLRCRLVTGRTHQLRVHLADAGWPILGDPLYAPAAARDAAPRLALHATRLAWPGGAVAPVVAADSPLPGELAALVAGA